MATKTKTKVEETTNEEENVEKKPEDNQELDNDTPAEDPTDDSNNKNPEPEKETFGKKMKKLGSKIKSGAKKALPYVGAFAAGAGAAVGALIVMTKPDGTEYELLPKNDDLVPADEFIDGEGSVVESEEGEAAE